ncbi:MAG: hypothetical protein ACXADY_08800 [Candidatus Hodarchaeales archaeon]|jgi:hypothetical protein
MSKKEWISMLNHETSSDILVIHQNRIIFSSGQGPLARHLKISATVSQVLTLFSERIMNGEQIHFIRFEKHRMIFLFSQNLKDDKLVAIVLIPIERSPRQVIPAMSIVLRMLEEFLQGNIDDVQNRQLDCFYQILSSPEKSLFVVPRSPEGILAALVLLTAFAHDMRLGVQRIASNFHFINPNNVPEIRKIIQKSDTTRILSFIHLPGVEENENILLFGLDSPSRQYFSPYSGEQVYDVICRIFGDQSNAAKMRKFIANVDAREIAQSISLLPQSEDDFIRKEILLSTVLQPGKDIIVTMSTPVMQKLRELAPSPSVTEETPIVEKATVAKEDPIITPDLESFAINSQKEVSEGTPHRLQPSEVELDTTFELVAEPDAIPIETQGLIEEPDAIPIEMQRVIAEPDETIPVEYFDSDVLARLDEARKLGFEYQFDSIPLILDTAPYMINISETQALPFKESNITIRLFPGGEQNFVIHIYTAFSRLSALRDSLEDLSIKIGGETHIRENHVSLVGPIERQQISIRALLWLSIVEYFTQVEMKLQKLSEQFEIPKDGSILIIPPKREYIKEKIPTKFSSFVEETKIRNNFEQQELWTLGKTQNEILSHLMTPLKQGDGVVFVTSDDNQEMEEIALFLLFISEICGIGFSRW